MNAFIPVLIVLAIGIAIVSFIGLIMSARVVPQRQQVVIERLGKYSRTLDAGFHLLLPFVDKVAYRHSMKEIATDVPSQTCITRDNIAVQVDGILYMQLVDAKAASYGIEDYKFGASQLAQTTLRSEIGKIDLDKTFEERDIINAAVVEAVDKASASWGVKILRYEIKDIMPPETVRDALEKQMRAERQRRAVVAESEGERQARINRSEGEKAEMINRSEGEKLRQENVAEGRAREIELIARATAEGLRKVAEVIKQPGGAEAVRLRVAEQYVKEFGNLAKVSNTMILPANVADVGSMIATALKTLESVKDPGASGDGDGSDGQEGPPPLARMTKL